MSADRPPAHYRSPMGDSGSLVGRDREIAALTTFLAESGPGGLVLSGEAGVGKSALWELGLDAAADAGALVLQARPAEGEERRSFSVLLDLLREVDPVAVPMGDPVRRSLETALLRRTVEGALDPHVVSVGTQAVLEHLATERRVVVFVDDVQWADTASTDALAFAARRLDDSPLRFVLARRAGFERSALEAFLVRRNLRYVEPRLLTVEETARLLAQRLSLTLNQRGIHLVHEQSRGNPLFALEVGRVLLERGVPEPGEPLGLPDEMAALFGLRVRGLDQELRTLLLSVSIDPHLTEPALVAVVGADVLERAVDAGLVQVSEAGQVRPWHPLLAAAARAAATPGQRQELHARLAKVVDTAEARLRHKALAVSEPDELLAERLADAAELAGSRGAVETALELAELALTRTPPESGSRPLRVLDLAARLGAANEAQRMTDLLEHELPAMPHGSTRGRCLMMLLDGMWGSIGRIERVIDRALAESAGDPQVRAAALEAKAFVVSAVKVSDLAQAVTWAEEARGLRAGPQDDAKLIGDALNWCRVHEGHPPDPALGPPQWKRLIWRGELEVAERGIRAAIAGAEDAGQFQVAIIHQAFLSEVLVRSGRIAEARELLASYQDLDLAARETPDEELLRAQIEVCSGDSPTAREWATRTRERAAAFGHTWYALEAGRALGTAALLLGEPETAVDLLREVFDHAVAGGMRDPGMFPVAPDLIEALLLLDRYDEARAVLTWLEELSREQAHPWGMAMASRSRLLVGLLDGSAPPGETSSAITAVADDLADLGLHHDAARANLVAGSALRRQRQWGLARDHLLRAVAAFDGLGAEGWSEATRGELSRVGGRRPAVEGALTPTELEVARLASTGLPNKTIARQLHVSISTVEAHLTQTYVKLGVRSRAQLGARLEQPSADQPPC